MLRSLLALTLVLTVSCSPVKKYESLPEVKAWEDEIQEFEKLDSTEDYPSDAILFTGSSSIRLWNTLKKDMSPYNVIQRGFGGSKLSDFVVYAERIVAPHPCSAIVIFIANDITGSENDKTPKEVAKLFRQSLKIIRNSHPGTPVFWIEVTPTPSRWKAWPKIREANELIRQICENQDNTYFISTSSDFIGNDGLPLGAYFVEDKLHLNPDGFKLWTGIIKKEINNVVPYPEVQIIAHRGASFDAPENTVAAANLAWKLGADAVECDIHLSADGRVIVSHDATTKRTGAENLTIKNTHSSDLRKLDVGSFKGTQFKGEKLPFLEELIATVPKGKELVVEIKCGPEVILPLEIIVDVSPENITFTFIAFDFNTISKTKETFPHHRCYWLCSDPGLYKKNIGLVGGAKLDGVSLNYNLINEEVAAELKEMGYELFTWTVDDAEIARRMVELGVMGITTNRPDYIRANLGKN